MIENAESLLGTKFLPPHYKSTRMFGRRSKAYYSLCPYPHNSPMTKDWRMEVRGPYPRCRPFPQSIINKSATWLFGQPVTFRVGAGENLDEAKTELINDVWTSNDMTIRSRSVAVCASNSGGAVLGFSYDEDNERKPIQIDVLDPTEQVYLYWSQETRGKLLMARVQYPIYNAADGQWWWHREEWTDETHVTYQDVASNEITADTGWTDPYTILDKVEEYSTWVKAEEEANGFGIVPYWYIRNRETGTEVGEGDLWTMFENIDMVNFTYNLGHRDNQKSIEPSKALIDLAPADGDQPTSDGDQKIMVLESTNDGEGGTQGKIEMLQTNSSTRQFVDSYAVELKNEIFRSVGSVDFEAEDVSNKGNLTSSVMVQMYAPLIERTNEKRQCMGEDGICVFLERMSQGLATIGAKGWSEIDDIQPVWSPYFEETESEKGERVTRVVMELENNLTTHDRAVKEIAAANRVMDVDDLLAEVQKEKAESEAKEAKEMEMQTSQMNRQRQSQVPVK